MDAEKIEIEKINTLEQVQDAIEVVESARENLTLNRSEKNQLQIASVKLRKLERSLIKKIQSELVVSLAADSKALKELSLQIKKSSDKLTEVAATIEKASNFVESFIKVVTVAVGLGLI